MTKIFCDICKQEIKSIDKVSSFRLSNKRGCGLFGDLCEECADAILDAIDLRRKKCKEESDG